MSRMNSRTKSAMKALREGLPDLPIMNLDMQPLPVKFKQTVNIRRCNEFSVSESRMLRTDMPTIHINGRAKVVGNCLLLGIGLDLAGGDEVEEDDVEEDDVEEDEVEILAKIFWKVGFIIRDIAYEEIGEKTRMIKLSPQNVPMHSDDYMDINLNDIKPNFEENGCIELEWEASLVWFFDGPLVDPNHKKAFCFHQICDILEIHDGSHKLQEEMEQELPQNETAGLHFRE